MNKKKAVFKIVDFVIRGRGGMRVGGCERKKKEKKKKG